MMNGIFWLIFWAYALLIYWAIRKKTTWNKMARTLASGALAYVGTIITMLVVFP